MHVDQKQSEARSASRLCSRGIPGERVSLMAFQSLNCSSQRPTRGRFDFQHLILAAAGQHSCSVWVSDCTGLYL